MSISIESVSAAKLIDPVTTQPGREDGRPVSTTPQREQRSFSQSEMESVVAELNETMRAINTNLSFSIDKDTNQTILKVIDTDSKEVIRQIPGEEVLRISRQITKLLGVLFDKAG